MAKIPARTRTPLKPVKPEVQDLRIAFAERDYAYRVAVRNMFNHVLVARANHFKNTTDIKVAEREVYMAFRLLRKVRQLDELAGDAKEKVRRLHAERGF